MMMMIRVWKLVTVWLVFSLFAEAKTTPKSTLVRGARERHLKSKTKGTKATKSRRLPCNGRRNCNDQRGEKDSKGDDNGYGWTRPPVYAPPPSPTTPRPTPSPVTTREPTPQPVASTIVTREPTPSPVTVTREPTTSRPVTREPTSPDTVTREPSTSPPVTREPSTSPPVTREPSTTTPPITREPTTSPPTTREPTSPGTVQTQTTQEPPAATTTQAAAVTTLSPQTTTQVTNEEPFDTVVNENGIESKCKIIPTQPKPVSTKVAFTYEMKVDKGANVEEVLADIEEATQKLLTTNLLDCNFSGQRMLQAADIEYTSISSAPKDVAFTPGTDVCQDVAGEVEDCYFVRGGITANHLPHEPTSDVVDQVSKILTDNQDVLAASNSALRDVSFTSFDGETTDVDDNGDNEDPPNSDAFSTDTGPSRGVVAGATVIAIAALAVFVAVLLLVRRMRRNETTTTVRPVSQDKSVLLEESSTSSSSDGFKAAIAPSDESDSEIADTAVELRDYEREYAHDPDTCTIPSCQFCFERSASQDPRFVPIGTQTHLSISDLSPPRNPQGSSDRAYAVRNTVDL